MTEHARQLLSGRYVSTDSLLHRLDPRSKLLMFPVLIASSFLLDHPFALLLLSGTLVLHYQVGDVPLGGYFKLVYSLRFLFLFTLIVYVLFTPGYRLWGVAGLSRDGLAQGLLVSLQLAIALGFSNLLAATTRAESMASGLEKLFSPLSLLRIPVDMLGRTLTLVLYFVDLIVGSFARDDRPWTSHGTWRERFASGLQWLVARLDEWLEHAEQVSLGISRGELFQEPTATAVGSFSRLDTAYLAVNAGVLVLAGMV